MRQVMSFLMWHWLVVSKPFSENVWYGTHVTTFWVPSWEFVTHSGYANTRAVGLILGCWVQSLSSCWAHHEFMWLRSSGIGTYNLYSTGQEFCMCIFWDLSCWVLIGLLGPSFLLGCWVHSFIGLLGLYLRFEFSIFDVLYEICNLLLRDISIYIYILMSCHLAYFEF